MPGILFRLYPGGNIMPGIQFRPYPGGNIMPEIWFGLYPGGGNVARNSGRLLHGVQNLTQNLRQIIPR